MISQTLTRRVVRWLWTRNGNCCDQRSLPDGKMSSRSAINRSFVCCWGRAWLLMPFVKLFELDMQLFNGSLDCAIVRGKSRKRELRRTCSWVQVYSRNCVLRNSQRHRASRVCVCRTQCGTWDSSIASVDTRDTLQGPHVEGLPTSLRGGCDLLFSCRNSGLLGDGEWSGRQCPPLLGETCLAPCCCKPHGRHPRSWQLSGWWSRSTTFDNAWPPRNLLHKVLWGFKSAANNVRSPGVQPALRMNSRAS